MKVECFKMNLLTILFPFAQEVVHGTQVAQTALRQGARGQEVPLPERGMPAHLRQRRGPRASPGIGVRPRVRLRDLWCQVPQSRESADARQEAGARRRQVIAVHISKYRWVPKFMLQFEYVP